MPQLYADAAGRPKAAIAGAAMIYVGDHPWIDTRPGKGNARWFVMWADTPDEALAAVYGCGGSADQFRTSANTMASYDVTPDQFAALVSLGVTVTDRFGLVEWCALRDGRSQLVEQIRAARTRGCV